MHCSIRPCLGNQRLSLLALNRATRGARPSTSALGASIKEEIQIGKPALYRNCEFAVRRGGRPAERRRIRRGRLLWLNDEQDCARDARATG